MQMASADHCLRVARCGVCESGVSVAAAGHHVLLSPLLSSCLPWVDGGVCTVLLKTSAAAAAAAVGAAVAGGATGV